MKNIKNILKITFAAVLLFAAALYVTDSIEFSAISAGAYSALSNIITIPTNAFTTYVGAPVSKGGQVIVTSNERKRSTYEHNKSKFGSDLSPSTLRLESKITNGRANLRFSLQEGDDTVVSPTEIRLLRNDKFVVDEIGFFIMRQPAGKTTGELLTYPNVSVFGAAQAADLMALYNGKLDITINKKKLIYNFDLHKFLQIPETQKTSATNFDQRTSTTGYYDLTPNLRLDGSGSNQIEINFPSFPAWAGASTDNTVADHVAVLMFRGFLVNNGSSNS